MTHQWMMKGVWVVVIAILIFTGCGGGGGGTNAVSPTSLSYTGSTDRAIITDSNAAEIAVGAVNGGTSGNPLTGFAALSEGGGTSDTQRLRVYAPATIMQNAVADLKTVSLHEMGAERTLVTEQETIYGPCGGQATGIIQVDDVTGAFSGSLTFSSYCESNVSLNGSTDFSGKINLSTDEIVNASFGFSYLTCTESSETYIIDGTLVIVNHPANMAITVDMLFQDGIGGDVFWIKDYQMDVVETGPTMSMTIFGNFYSPQYGYVVLSTQQALVVDTTDQVPSAGILIAEGENGSAGGPTMARLTCLSAGLFKVETDTDGDGDYDTVSVDLFWDDF
ncbi:hypothetical protein [Desulfosarcina sp.]|uniref:hypothetical protein n=1 Tax=Desulfosarcina sp. TaxID=2027861 RepID=UPI0035615B23